VCVSIYFQRIVILLTVTVNCCCLLLLDFLENYCKTYAMAPVGFHFIFLNGFLILFLTPNAQHKPKKDANKRT
jgi:hypothetical protein